MRKNGKPSIWAFIPYLALFSLSIYWICVPKAPGFAPGRSHASLLFLPLAGGQATAGGQSCNTLTLAEKAAGWKLLFDGKTTRGWHSWKKAAAGSSWIAEDGALKLNAVQQPDGSLRPADGGDLLTDEEFENFDLRLEWKISPCGNSGVMFNVREAEKYNYPWETGPEVQVLDNTCHPDAQFESHRAGCLYDMIPVNRETVKPAGEWNALRITIRNGKSQFWLNGRRVVKFEMFTPGWQRMIENSKFKDMPDFGKARKGRICLQDHNDAIVWFRNIKIRELE